MAEQHCVGVFHGLRDPNKNLHPQFAVFTAVFAKHGGDFYLFTAAHCIRESRKAIESGLTSVQISLVIGAGDGERIFVPNFIANKSFVSIELFDEKQGFDFACINLDSVAVAKLEGSGMVPVEKYFCVRRDESVEHHAVFGFPKTRNVSEFTEISGQTIVQPEPMATLLKVPADRSGIPSDPVGPSIGSDPRFIAVVNEEMAKQVGMKGLSGGLMFGVDLERRVMNGKEQVIARSRPIAIQAKWWHQKYAAGNYLVDIFEKLAASKK
ncbi:MAG: hypothetical protein WKF77_24040 [Planctomycetaceae bacterium]